MPSRLGRRRCSESPRSTGRKSHRTPRPAGRSRSPRVVREPRARPEVAGEAEQESAAGLALALASAGDLVNQLGELERFARRHVFPLLSSQFLTLLADGRIAAQEPGDALVGARELKRDGSLVREQAERLQGPGAEGAAVFLVEQLERADDSGSVEQR